MSDENIQITLKEVEVQKLDLQPGQSLMVTVKHEDVDQTSLEQLKNLLSSSFPNNQVMVFGMGSAGEITFAVVNDPVASQPNVGYCGVCSCGKKERVEAERNG